MAEMVTIDQLKIGDNITFLTYGVNTVPNVVNGVVKALEEGDALRNPTLAAINHANIYSSLPPGTTNNYQSYNYLLIKLSDGTSTEIGLPWVVVSSLSRTVRETMVISIPDRDASEISTIISLLSSRGYLNSTAVMVPS